MSPRSIYPHKKRPATERGQPHKGQPPGRSHPNFRGAKHIDTLGYVVLTDPETGGRKREHMLVAERALGKPLPPEAEVHHWNEDKTDNRNCNLVICQDAAYHRLLHARAARLRGFGRLDVKRCPECGAVKRLTEFYSEPKRWDGRHGFCAACVRARAKERYANRRRA